MAYALDCNSGDVGSIPARLSKICAKCNEEKPIDQFSVKNKKTGKRRAHCHACQRPINQARYAQDKSSYFRRNKERRKRLSEWLIELKSKPCMDCGNSYPSCAMDFDHRDRSQKKFTLNGRQLDQYSREMVLAEIAKCDLVCAVCHRIRTHAPHLRAGLTSSP